jgi:hypothetical protein
MNLTPWIGRLLGLDDAVQIGSIEHSWAAPWAHDGPAWLVLGCVGLAVLALVFYTRLQHIRRVRTRLVLGLLRAAVLVLLLVMLAEPVLTVRVTSRLRPTLWLLLDGTESMTLRDQLPEAEAARLAQTVGLPHPGGTSPGPVTEQPARVDFVKALLSKRDDNLLERLGRKARLQAFLLDRPDGVRALEASGPGGDQLDPGRLCDQWTAKCQVTALGAALEDLARRQTSGSVSGVVIFSDFNQNAGPSALEAARRLGLSVYAVGVGPTAAVDLSVELRCPDKMKKDEHYPLVAIVRQEGLAGRTATVKFFTRPAERTSDSGSWTLLDQRNVVLSEPAHPIEISYVPKVAGRFEFYVEADRFAEEVLPDNNRTRPKEVLVHDNPMRLLYVEYDPTWEWRFVKEVFHRDRLVGPEGFRTFLHSAHPRVQTTGELYVPTLSRPRGELFAYDVILLGDVPAAVLSPSFCQMVEEFVDKLGGGLVVVSGPRFGPGQLAHTRLADMLPVKVDPGLRLRDRKPFALRRTAEAAQYEFMRLAGDAAENENAWNNLGLLPWYQPVERLHPWATALAEHPTDKCVDGKTPQPLVAVRQYGRGEVVYLGFNEMWRLRRGYGERYYREFWGAMIHRLASRHALGSGKRFDVRTDRPEYRPDEQVILTVEAFDAQYRQLTEEKVPGHKLQAEWILPEARPGAKPAVRPLAIPQLSEGVFETRLTPGVAGEHRVRVTDPVTQEKKERTFQVTRVGVEMERAVRNGVLQRDLAGITGGKSYDLLTVSRLPDEVRLTARTETNVRVIELWDTWLVFGLVGFFMLGEWLGRKWANLP